MTDIIPAVNQRKWAEMELALSLEDMAIFEWMVLFAHSNRIVTMTNNGKTYYCFKPKKIVEDLPILQASERTVYRHINSLILAGLIERMEDNSKNKTNFYCFGIRYDEYFDTEVCQNVQEVVKNVNVGCQKCQPNNRVNNNIEREQEKSIDKSIQEKKREWRMRDDISDEEVKYYTNMEKLFPRVMQMTDPLTYDESIKLVSLFRKEKNLEEDEAKQELLFILGEMDNYMTKIGKPKYIYQAYVSAYRTAISWFRMRARK